MSQDFVSRDFTSTPAQIEFYAAERVLTPGKPFVGTRMVDRDGDPCFREHGCGYTKKQSLESLQASLLVLPHSFERADSLKLVAEALAALPAETEAGWQRWVHDRAEASYHALNRAERRSREKSRNKRAQR